MMQSFIFFSIFILSCNSKLLGIDYFDNNFKENQIVKATKRIYIPECPGAYNPSLIKLNENYLLTFRYQPDRGYHPWISYIGVILLNDSFVPICKAQLLDTRTHNNITSPQSEDARVFSFRGKVYIVFNDNMELDNPGYTDRRDMYLAELIVDPNNFQVGNPLRLIHTTKYRYVLWQKNWSPFEWNGNLLLSYSMCPHEILSLNLKNGACQSIHSVQKSIQWDYGTLRGSTPAQLVDGEYLAFFHSGTETASACSENRHMWHYFMGAYTFSSEPPFEFTAVSPAPINALEFYTYSSYFKRVIYPGGFIINNSSLYLAYGKDDCEIWIATIDLQELKNSLVPIPK